MSARCRRLAQEMPVSKKGRDFSYPVERSGTVWMVDGQPTQSASRAVAVDVMRCLGMDECDWRTRDKIITAIADRINGMLDYAAHSGKK